MFSDKKILKLMSISRGIKFSDIKTGNDFVIIYGVDKGIKYSVKAKTSQIEAECCKVVINNKAK